MQKTCPICQFPFEEAELQKHIEEAHKGSTEPEIAQMREQLKEDPKFRCAVCHVALPSPEAVREHHRTAHGL